MTKKEIITFLEPYDDDTHVLMQFALDFSPIQLSYQVAADQFKTFQRRQLVAEGLRDGDGFVVVEKKPAPEVWLQYDDNGIQVKPAR